ncbi:MAG: phage tail tape measure protein [Atopobiaceae bacterium]|nr:phage tail tape measure protein [Atopobiaceae bacterium]
MARVEGLTIIINGDATPFKRAMQEAKAEGTMLRRHLEAVNKLVRFDPGSTVLLTRRQQLLNNALAQSATHLKSLQVMNDKYAAQSGELTAAQQRHWMQVQRRMSEVELEYAKLRQQAIQYGAAASDANLAAQARFSGTQRMLSTFSTQLLSTSAVIGAIGGLSVYAAAQFEQSFAGVRKTIIATQAEYDELAAATREIALAKPIGVNDVNEIMMYAGQLGIATRYLADFASTMADLDVATDMDLEEGSMQLARFMNIVGMSQSDVDRLGATIVDLGNNSATTESQIMLMAMRIAGSGSNIGLTAQNVLALATALSSVGIQAEMGGNAISTIMNRIDKEVALNGKSLDTWAATAGMTAEEFKYNWQNNVQETLLAVIKGMGTFRDEGGNLNVLLKDMGISYMRQIDTMQRLSRAGQLTEDMFVRANTAWANNTALVREATQRYDTAESKVKMMGNAIYDAGITIGQSILPSFKDLVLGITDAVQAFGRMDEGTKETIVNIGGFVVASGLLVKALELGAGGLGKLTAAYASLKTWLVLATDEEYLNIAVTRTNTVVEGENTVATEANAAAKLAAAKNTGILTAAQNFLKSSTLGLAAALGITNGMLLGIGVAAAAAAAIIVTIASAADPMKRLTKATEEQKAEVDAARRKYETLSSSLGEHTDATVKAKAAYEDLNKEYQENAETLGELHERMAGVVSGLREVSEAADEATAEADSSAGRILNAVDGINQFKDATDDAGKMRLLGYVSDLKDNVDGLDITMADCVDENEQFAAAMQEAEEAARRIRFDNAYEQFGTFTVAADEANAAMEDLIEQYTWLKDSDYVDFVRTQMMSGDVSVKGDWAVIQQYEQLKQASDDANASIEETIATMRENADRSDICATALRYQQDANVSLADSCAYLSEKMGLTVTENDVLAYKEKQAAESTKQASDEVIALRDSLESLSAKYPILSELVDGSGASFQGLAEWLTQAGISAQDFEKGIEGMAETAQDGLNRIDTESGIALQDFIANLDHNREAMANWGADMDALWAQYAESGSKATQDFLQYLAELGPEQATLVHEILESGNLEEIAAKWAETGEHGKEAYLESIGAMGSKVQELSRDIAQNISSEIESGIAKGAEAVSLGMDTMRAVLSVQGLLMESEASKTFNAIGDSATSMNKYASSTYFWGYDMVSNLASGMNDASYKVDSAANSLASKINSVLHFSLPDEGPLREGGGPRAWMADMVDEMVLGMQSRETALSAQTGRLAMLMRDPLGVGLGIGTANWNAANRYSAESETAGTVNNITEVGGITVNARTDADPNEIASLTARKVRQALSAQGR